MIDLLVATILAVCPPVKDARITECHERMTNCAVREGGRIDETTIKRCIEKEIETRESSSGSN